MATRLIFSLLASAFVLSAFAQPQIVRIRGQIEKVDGNMLAIKARDGSDYAVKLADDVRVTAQVKASLDEIKPGAFIGVTSMPEADGSQKAIAIHFFLESQRGVVPDRQMPWDLQPNSMMTNAYVETSVASVNGHVVTVKHKDGEAKVIVTPETSIVRMTPGERSEIKPGAQIIIFGAQKRADGSLMASAISVGRDGIRPPM